MEWLPAMPYSDNKTSRQIIRFGGIQYGQGGNDGEFSDTLNLSSRLYPAISQREGRAKAASPERGTALFGWSKLCIVDGTKLLYDGEQVGAVSEGEKQFAVVNTKLCIWPDKKYLDLDSMEFGNLDESILSKPSTTTSFSTNSITLQIDEIIEKGLYSFFAEYHDLNAPHLQEQWVYIKTYTSARWNQESNSWELEGEEEVEVQNANGKIVMLKKSDVSGNYVLNTRTRFKDLDLGTDETTVPYTDNNDKGYYAVVTRVETDDSGSGWQSIFYSHKLTYDIHNATNANDTFEGRFRSGDIVDISGCKKNEQNNKEKIKIKEVNGLTLTFADDTFASGQETEQITIRRPVPNMTFICENDNRLWGVSDEDKTIYASALGDPTNFYVYDGVSTDSYAVAVGSDGKWTGCCPLGGNMLFWKEDKLHKLLGSSPSEYQMYTYTVQGVQDGSWKSMKVINEVLYYKGEKGIYAYGGSTPVLLSENFGTRRFGNASGGSDGQHYYISMQDLDTQAWGVWAYNTLRGIWLQQLDERVIDFTSLDGDMYYLSGDGKAVWKVGGEDETPIEWSATLYPMDEQTNGKKGYSKILMRFELEQGAFVKVELKEDYGRWKKAGAVNGARRSAANFYVMPGRCDTFQIRLSGKGRCVIKSITREFDVGSEV